MNKSDLLYDADSVMTLGDSVFISALHGNGIDALLAAIDRALPPDRRRCVFLFPYDDMSPSSLVREDSTAIIIVPTIDLENGNNIRTVLQS